MTPTSRRHTYFSVEHTLHIRKVQLDFHCKRELRSTMSESTEQSQRLMSVKEEIKEEEFDSVPFEYLFEIQKVEVKPELEHDCKTETRTSPTLTCKEENSSLMEIKEEPDLREYGDDDSSTKVKSRMSGSTEPSQLLMSVKEEIKDEGFDDFLPENLSASQKVEEKPGLEHDCKTRKSPSLTCKEENDRAMEIEEEEELDLREYGHDDSSPARDLQRIHSSKRIMGGRRKKVISHQQSNKRKKRHECSQCFKTFETPSSLAIHQRTHTGEKPYQCFQCGKAFNQTGDLKTHQRIHTGEKPYHCSQCGKTFRLKGDLKKHLMTHTGEKPHQCTLCGKGFKTSNELRFHKMTHTGEKPHQCSQCGKSFSQMCNLKTHQMIHTGEKPYHCPQCGKTFTQMSNLNKHQRIHSGEKP